MKMSEKDFMEVLNELFMTADPPRVNNENAGFFFDDETLENILYGSESSGPTPANLFLHSRRLVDEIWQVHHQGDISENLSLLSTIGAKKMSLSIPMAFKLAIVLGGIIPQYPLPVIRFDLWALSPLIESLWELALEKKDKDLQSAIGTPLYRWFEHLHQYGAARRILQVLIDRSEDPGDKVEKAVFINNYAYEYLLEEKYAEAAPFFEKAAALFKENSNRFEFANARANYWMCRIAVKPVIDMEVLVEELPEMEGVLIKFRDWRGRKILVLKARMAEEKGNVTEAISWMEQAIEAARESNTQYPELDRVYLKQLQLRYENKSLMICEPVKG
jgi:tetratricopeptide (TPR) repeat protein